MIRFWLSVIKIGVLKSENYGNKNLNDVANGVNSYSISATGAVSQGPDERTAAGLPATYYFDEHIGADPAPMLFNIHEENVGETSADIAWSTNEPATSVVRYGTASGIYPNTVSDATQELNHQLTLTSLTVAATYYYVVESTDTTSNTTTSQERIRESLT